MNAVGLLPSVGRPVAVPLGPPRTTSSTRRQQGHEKVGQGALFCPVGFDGESARRKPARGYVPDQPEAGRSKGLDQPMTSPRRGHDEVEPGALLRPVKVDGRSTLRNPARGCVPEQPEAGPSKGFDHSMTSPRRGHDEFGHGALLRPVEVNGRSTRRKLAHGYGPGNLRLIVPRGSISR